MKSLGRRIAIALMIVSMSAGVMAATPLQAMAASPTCSLNGCNGTDPYATHCADSVVSPNPVPNVNIYNGSTRVGVIELRFSRVCRTTWARVTYVGGFGAHSYVATGIYRSDGVNYDYPHGTCDTFCRDYLTPGYTSYGRQVYDGGYLSWAAGYVCGADSTCYTAPEAVTGSY
jgi:hypothetical protein